MKRASIAVLAILIAAAALILAGRAAMLMPYLLHAARAIGPAGMTAFSSAVGVMICMVAVFVAARESRKKSKAERRSPLR